MKKISSNRRVLLVGEGRETEYNYFVGFRNAMQEELDATATSVKVVRGKGGNARNIVEKAIEEAKKFKPNRKLGDRVFLVMDTEGPGRAPELPAAENLAKANQIEIVYSCPAFEYWLLCHFPKPSRRYFKDCDTVIVELNKKWESVCKTPYDKADEDVFDRLSDKLGLARDEALATDLHHLRSQNAALRLNPSTQVYELIALLIGVRTGKRCPVTGTWKLIGDNTVTIQVDKGAKMPVHDKNPVTWQL